jgi:hypothetical protein
MMASIFPGVDTHSLTQADVDLNAIDIYSFIST